jgi:serine phosphatase RsbU (regulator of sigma subunit)
MSQDLESPLIRQLREENRRLRRAVNELSVLNELARAIAVTKSPEETIRRIADRSRRAVQAEQGVITLIDERREELPRTLVRIATESLGVRQYRFGQALLGWMIINKKPVIVNNTGSDLRFRGAVWDPSVRSVLCVPMIIRGKLRGILGVYNKKNSGGFTEDDQRLLTIIASQSAQLIENARLFEEERTLMRIQRELELASRIQTDLLPKSAPRLVGYDIAGTTIPASKVGSDYFDFIPLAESSIAICVGDVSGKELPAALLMANLQAALRSHTHVATSAKECIALSNAHLRSSMSPDKFATLFYCVLDTRAHRLTYCNAGHEPPFLFKADKKHHRLITGGTVLGIIDEFVFEEATVAFEPGDILIAYSDGITEAMNENSEQFGEEKLAEFIRQNSEISAAELIGQIIQAVKIHAGASPQHDDITIVVVKRIA